MNSKERILLAAAELARDAGAGNLSLDAIAARAGISKGGLLYNFPTKAALMGAMVENFLKEFETNFAKAAEADGKNLLATYITMSAADCNEMKPGAAGVMAAMAEDPDFVKPINAFKRRLLDRLEKGHQDREAILIAYLALEGLRSNVLFDTNVLTQEEQGAALNGLMKMAEAL